MEGGARGSSHPQWAGTIRLVFSFGTGTSDMELLVGGCGRDVLLS